MLVLGFAAFYEPISYLARPLDNPRIDTMLNERRTRFGNTPINKTNAAMLAIRILREGGILGILSDVNAHPKEGVFVPFFGVPACTPSGAAMMAIRAGRLYISDILHLGIKIATIQIYPRSAARTVENRRPQTRYYRNDRRLYGRDRRHHSRLP